MNGGGGNALADQRTDRLTSGLLIAPRFQDTTVRRSVRSDRDKGAGKHKSSTAKGTRRFSECRSICCSTAFQWHRRNEVTLFDGPSLPIGGLGGRPGQEAIRDLEPPISSRALSKMNSASSGRATYGADSTTCPQICTGCPPFFFSLSRSPANVIDSGRFGCRCVAGRSISVDAGPR